MTKDEAFQVAKAFVEQEGIRYVECYSQRLIPEDQLHLWCGDHGVLKGPREKVWSIGFKIKHLLEGEVCTANSFDVLVDDATKECALFWAM